ncbi:MAG: endonuclease/exonuclease/phosphatase family protein [Pirellulales bacterium]
MEATSSADTPTPRPRSVGRTIDAFAVAVLAATVAGWCGRWHWLLDIASHFRWYWLLAAVAGLAVSIRRPRPAAIACLAAAAVGNARELLPAWLPPPAAAASAGPAAQGILVVSVNVHRVNDDPTATRAYLRDRRPDAVAVLEVDDTWAASLDGLADDFPHRIIHPRADNFGIAMLSRWPLTDAEVVHLGGTPHPSILATLSHPSGRLRLVATHPMPPWNGHYAALMRDQFDAVAAAVVASDVPCIVMGDLNATPWSHAFRRLTARSGLRDSSLGRGIQPTWNVRLWAPRIPIDHVLVPDEVTVLRRAVGPDVGSDHLPVEAELALPRR